MPANPDTIALIEANHFNTPAKLREVLGMIAADIDNTANAVTGYYMLSDDATVPSEAEVLADGVPFLIPTTQDYSIQFPNTTAKYWKVFEPATEPEKTHNLTDHGEATFGNDGLFAVGVAVGSLRGYIANYDTYNTESATSFNS